MTTDELLGKAIHRLTEIDYRHPSMVLYSQAKMLHKLIPDLIQLLELARTNWDSGLQGEDFAETFRELVSLAKIVVEETNE